VFFNTGTFHSAETYNSLSPADKIPVDGRGKARPATPRHFPVEFSVPRAPILRDIHTARKQMSKGTSRAGVSFAPVKPPFLHARVDFSCRIKKISKVTTGVTVRPRSPVQITRRVAKRRYPSSASRSRQTVSLAKSHRAKSDIHRGGRISPLVRREPRVAYDRFTFLERRNRSYRRSSCDAASTTHEFAIPRAGQEPSKLGPLAATRERVTGDVLVSSLEKFAESRASYVIERQTFENIASSRCGRLR